MSRKVKPETGRRIVVSLSVSDESEQLLTLLRRRLRGASGREPTTEEIREYVRKKAFEALLSDVKSGDTISVERESPDLP